MSNKNLMLCIYRIEFTAPENFHPDKRDDFRLSRYALSQLTSSKTIEIDNHLHLRNEKSTLVSISHTKDCGAAIISNEENILSIGIDIEWKDRVHRKGVEKFFIRDEDDTSYSILELWSLKESAFKALSPLYQGEKTLVLKDFVIKGNYFYYNEQKLGETSMEYRRFEERELLVTVAKLYSNIER